ncbi:MAG: VWA domain-containing protein [Archangiaceae bacterium]|nr:VWA domain-containing protein [Archangiaceae bacterium]
MPLANATDLVFLIDRSFSMSETASFGDQSQQPGAAARVDGVAIGIPSWQSGPLLPDKLTVAKRELAKVLAHLPDGTRFAVAFYDEQLDWFSPSLSTLNAQTRAELQRYVDSIHPRGATGSVPALQAAFATKPRRIVLLSDGITNLGGDDAQLLTAARAQIRAGVRFDTVSIGTPELAQRRSDVLASLALESGGLSQSY